MGIIIAALVLLKADNQLQISRRAHATPNTHHTTTNGVPRQKEMTEAQVEGLGLKKYQTVVPVLGNKYLRLLAIVILLCVALFLSNFLHGHIAPDIFRDIGMQ